LTDPVYLVRRTRRSSWGLDNERLHLTRPLRGRAGEPHGVMPPTEVVGTGVREIA
jgi:hypothetical protein